MAADPTKLSYFSLPGEVRNKIMDYVLVHGDIQPYRPVSQTPARIPETTANVERPGIQLMATCKQAYLEGHTLFYSSNTFHLSPTVPFWWSDRLQPKHKAMIKRISIQIGLVELTSAMLDEIKSSSLAGVGRKNGPRSGAAVADALTDVWISKLRYIAAWTSLEEVELCAFDRTHILQHHDIAANLGQIDLWHNPYWRNVLNRSHLCVFGNIRQKVWSVGWTRTKGWLRVRKPDEMTQGIDFWIGAVE